MKKTISMLGAAAVLAVAAPAFADHDEFRSPAQIVFQQQLTAAAMAEQAGFAGPYRHGALTATEIATIANFESETNYRLYIGQLSLKYGVPPAVIERMADRQLQRAERRFAEYVYESQRSDRWSPRGHY